MNMELKSSFILIVLLTAATTKAQLLCFHCNDCTVQTARIEQCGINYETVAPPMETTTPLPGTTGVFPPSETTAQPADTTPVTTTTMPPEITTELPPVTTNPTTNGPPTPTLPTTISTTHSTASDFATPPITPLVPTAQMNSRLVISLEPSPRFVCVVSNSKVDNREVVHRGCAQLGHTVHDTCNSASGGQYDNCSVCMTHLCNRG